MVAFYNDNDPFCCRVLRGQVAAGDLPPGDVDGRDIRDVRPEDIAGYDQVHLFAGIGGFPLGFRRAGMPDDFRIWTGGDPCQGNSKSRGRRAFDGPDCASHFLRLVDAVRPPIVLRENPADTLRAAPWPWHRFRAGLESSGYAVLPFRLRSCCLGADHRRDRLFLLAASPDAPGAGLEGRDDRALECDDAPRRDRRRPAPRICRRADRISHRVDRLRALGNAVDPRVAEWIGRMIMGCEGG
jgi:DNA (cytosine-5)-methyltransferase 1